MSAIGLGSASLVEVEDEPCLRGLDVTMLA
jgi:hypothetical protein